MNTTEKDQWDKMSKELLPFDTRDRPDVAAELRKMGKAIEKLNEKIANLETENNHLRVGESDELALK